MNNNDDDMKQIITKLYEDTVSYKDPHKLEYYKTQIKKNIPFGKRLNFAAYLFSQINNNKVNRKNYNNPVVSENDTTLYLNIGRMGNVHRKIILNFINENSSVKDSDIVNLRMHERYSFITLNKDKAESLMSDLNGKEFRKRTIVINPTKNNNN